MISASILPELSEELLSPEAAAAVGRLRERAPYLFAGTQGERFHDLLGDALQELLRRAGPRDVAATIASAGQTLRHRHRVIEALSLYAAHDVPEPCVALLELHGLALLEGGNADIVEEAFMCIERSGRTQPPKLIAMRAIAESRLGRFDVAESWFNQALNRTGKEDAAMIEIKYLYACDLVRRGRPDALDLIQKYADDDAMPDDLRAGVISLLAQTLILAGREAEAAAAIERALPLVEGHPDDALRARVYTRAAYVALYRNDATEARRYATLGAEIAERTASFGIATGAYSVLYVLAFDAEEPLAALDHLERLFDNGLKSGNLQFQFYYLANVFEIAAEMYDLERLARIDAALASFDLEYDDADSKEALLPGEALRASWAGEFEHAFRLLHPTAAHQATPDRVALRWAEVAFYAAAALRPADASDAIERATVALADADAPSRCARSRILLCIASALLGQSTQSAAFLADLERQALPARLRALVPLATALAARVAGAKNHEAMARALDETRAHEFAGFARTIEALPLRRIVASLRVDVLAGSTQ